MGATGSWLPAAASVMGSVTGAMGNSAAGEAAVRAGEAKRQAAQFEAEQLRVNAGQSVAAAQRVALETERQAALVESRGRAVAAASGGGASDPTVVHLLSRVASEGAYRAAVARYEGDSKARQMRMQAAATEYGGEIAAQGGRDAQAAYQTKAFGSIISGAGSLFSRYGKGGFGASGSLADGATVDAGTDYSVFASLA